MEFLYTYGLFLAEALTIVAAIVAVIMAVAGVAVKPKSDRGEIEVEDISEHLNNLKHQFEAQILSKDELKARHKAQNKADKVQDKDKEKKSNLFVMNFEGGTDASEVSSLREEITAILTIATKEDEVLLKVDSGGGVVHGYGLAASQIARLTEAQIPVTVSVDKIAASGGYMMASVADKIIAAPFSIIGSIGVMAQLPNFHKLLKKNDVDFELFTAGEFKRTVTMFGENTDKGREKFMEELEETHVLFKEFVANNRQSVNIDEVATGEHWYGAQAIKMGLVDKLQTSDDYLMSKLQSHKIVGVRCVIKESWAEKLGLSVSIAVERFTSKWLQRSQTPMM